ncbi:MAG: TatD family hydrolase [Alistipes sp.]|nr:TatD family hydrolase [Alistipes sp.]
MDRFIDIHTHHPTDEAITPTAAGIHPWDAALHEVSEVESEIAAAEVVGEIGLDILCDVEFERQLSVFREQLSLAERYDKPVILHCVRAFEPMMKVLAGYRLRAVIFHGFIGSPEQAKRAIERGYFLSFGERTFRSAKTIEALRQTPINQIFIETDDNYTPIAEIYEKVANLRGITVEQLTTVTKGNLERILG